MKTVFKPTLKNVALALALFLVAAGLWRLIYRPMMMDLSLWGFPLTFYSSWGPCPPYEPCSETSLPNLALDLVFWYLAAALGFWLFRRRKPAA